MLDRLGKGLILAGFATFVAAVVWWYMYYEQLLGTDVKRLSKCFYETTPSCALGNKIVSAFGDIPPYSPDLLWLAAGMFGAGIILIGVKPGVDESKRKDKDRI